MKNKTSNYKIKTEQVQQVRKLCLQADNASNFITRLYLNHKASKELKKLN